MLRLALLFLLGWGWSHACSRSNPCVGNCTHGERRCVQGGVASCAYQLSTGCLDWTILPCQVGYTCQNGQCAGNIPIPDGGTGPCTSSCKQGQRGCTQAGLIYSCMQNLSNGCWSWSTPAACPAGSVCQGDHCVASGCQNQCNAGALRCLGNAVQTCIQQNRCFQWGNDSPCAAGQTCANGVCVSGQEPCPSVCSADQDCRKAACGTRTQCKAGTCQTPSATCGACQTNADCSPAVCGDRTVCHQGLCQKPGSFCPPSCANPADCQIPACGTATACQNGVCQNASQCPGSCQSDADCSNVPACGTRKSCRSGQCAEAFQLTAEEKDLFDALNRARQNNGLPLVRIDEKLTCAARKHANDVGRTRTCGHVGSDGSWPWDRAQACGFPQTKWTVNEIAAGPGFRDGDDAVSGWRQSPGHWDAIVHPQAKTVGVGIYNTCFIALFDCCVKGSD